MVNKTTNSNLQIAVNILLRMIIVLLFVSICVDNIYSLPYPYRFNLRNQQDVIKNEEASLPVISLKERKTFIKGKVYGYNPVSNSSVRIAYHNPIMNEPEAFVVEISRNGDFFMDVPILSNSTCLFVSDYYKEYILLSPGDTCFINIDAKKVREIKEFNAIKRSNIDNQYVRFGGAFAEVNNELNYLHFWSNSINLFNDKNEYKNLAQYKTYILSTLEKSLKELLNTNISKPTKELITINLQQQAIRCLLNDRILLENHSDKGDYSSTPTVDIDYFSFLEIMNLNSLNSFYGRFFSNIIYECLQIEDMVMPLRELINKRSMPQKALVYEDIRRQKDYLTRILKENNGPAFDLLEVLNFTSKIRQDLTLDEWEIEDLMQLKEPVYYNYVTRKNELLSSRLENIRKKSASNIFDATAKKDNYFEEIIPLYKGNIIMVNYWSMDCLGALNAIKVIEPLKMKYKNRKVVFIYLTDDHFLYPTWENKAVQIDGIHYRLNKKQIDYILSKYKMMDVTPIFLVFDKKGECILNQKGYSEDAIKNIFYKMDKEL